MDANRKLPSKHRAWNWPRSECSSCFRSLLTEVKKVRLEFWKKFRISRVRFSIYQSLRKIVDSRDAIVSPSSEALPLPDLLFHSPTTTPQFFAAMLSYSTRMTYIIYVYIRILYILYILCICILCILRICILCILCILYCVYIFESFTL